jgi:hypothetical protein
MTMIIKKRKIKKKEIIIISFFLFCYAVCRAQIQQDHYPAYSPSKYGSAVNVSALTNYKIDEKKVSFKFRAKHTGFISGIRVYVMGRGDGHTGYGAGNGGIWRVSLRNDSTANHWPAQLVLTSLTRNMVNNTCNDPLFPLLSFNSSINVTAGKLYHIVFENIDPEPFDNYTSVNTLTMWPQKALNPEQPFAANFDWNSLYSDSPYTTWKSAPGNFTQTPIMEYYYTDGYSTGMGYVEVWSENPKSISGTSAVRETFTVSGNDRTISTVAVRLRRLSGDQPLTMRFEKADGILMSQGTISASSIHTAYSWIRFKFHSKQRLIAGQSYNLILLAPARTCYDTYAIRKGSSSNDWFTSNTSFSDGYSQFTTGSNWLGWDMWGQSNRKDGDLQFYFY